MCAAALLDAWRARPRRHRDDPVDAWKSMLMDNPEVRRRHPTGTRQRRLPPGGLGRGPGDRRRLQLHTVNKYGPDRIVGFSPIPAMSHDQLRAGSRFLQLFGGVPLSFYDWYCDLPPASPEVWGEQTDVHESADWYNAQASSR